MVDDRGSGEGYVDVGAVLRSTFDWLNRVTWMPPGETLGHAAAREVTKAPLAAGGAAGASGMMVDKGPVQIDAAAAAQVEGGAHDDGGEANVCFAAS